ncbi:MAG: hypothetical protein WD768_20495 [Phycisphaeraceae bacterium]
MPDVATTPGILFTAFEPSGDQVAAPVIARIRQAQPNLPIYAFGGAKMEAAGAAIIERTGQHAVMLAGAVSQVGEHLTRLKRLKVWLREHALNTLVPVDSPAANWSICKAVRKIQPKARITHLVAPQLWAWAPWRLGKLRRLTHHVLCLLPFEPDWFQSRGVKATFVGHPLYNQITPGGGEHGKPTGNRINEVMGPLASHPGLKLALLPGSRAGEHFSNWPTMLRTFEVLSRKHPGLCGTVAAMNDEVVQRLAGIKPKGMKDAPQGQTDREHGEPSWWPDSLHFRVGAVDEILEWCDAVLVVSGTATLQTAIHEKPMVVLYNYKRWKWHTFARYLIRTRTFAIPNLIAEAQGQARAVKEFVPHFGRVEPIVEAVEELLTDKAANEKRVEALKAINALFQPAVFAQRAADAILALANLGPA